MFGTDAEAGDDVGEEGADDGGEGVLEPVVDVGEPDENMPLAQESFSFGGCGRGGDGDLELDMVN